MAPPAPRTPEAGLRNLTDVIAFYESEGRLPVAHGESAKDRALGAWLVHRRRETAQGTLSPIYRGALAAIPGWDQPSTRKAGDEARWQQRPEEMQNLRAAGGDWPRHQKTNDTHERTLGVWLHGQRINYRAGKLSPAKENKLNEVLPGWREGRGHRGGRRASLGQKPSSPGSDQQSTVPPVRTAHAGPPAYGQHRQA